MMEEQSSTQLHQEQTLLKLLIKITLRAETEHFRLNATCWRNRLENPLLNRSIQALRCSPLLVDSGISDELFQQFFSVLPKLSAQLKTITGKDLLTGIANDLGNMWPLILVPKAEEKERMSKEAHKMSKTDPGKDQLDEDAAGKELFDDVAERKLIDNHYAETDLFDDHIDQTQLTAQEAIALGEARALRIRSMTSFRLALHDIAQSGGGFHATYDGATLVGSLSELSPPSLRLACEHAFDALDFVINQAINTDEPTYRRKTR